MELLMSKIMYEIPIPIPEGQWKESVNYYLK